MHYFVLKSGMQLFDLSLAYGLARMIQAGAEDMDIRLSDQGSHYLISAPSADKLNVRSFSSAIPESDDRWRWVFFSAQGKEKAKHMREGVRELLANKQLMLSLLKKHLQPVAVTVSSKKEADYVTLPQSLDPTAAKGTHFPVRTKTAYSEGGNVYVPREYWALASVGLASLADWRRGQWLLTLLAVPDRKGLDVSHAQDIREAFSKKWVNRVSVETCLAHAVVLLVRELTQRRTTQRQFRDRFSSLIFGAAVKTATQWKPSGGGVYPLEFLNNIADANPEIALELFNTWDKVFRVGNVKGNEPLAFALAEFITRPSLKSYEEYIRIHLRMNLGKQIHQLYKEQLLEEVTNYVQLN